jgi:hypothetical protein
MTDIAIRGEAGRHMVGLLCALIVVEMTSGTGRRRSHKCAIAVTFGAFSGPMCTLEAKTRHRLVIPRPSDDSLPGLRCVAVFTMVAQLQPVSVILPSDPVALLTFQGCTLYDAVQVTLAAFDGAMPAHQGKVGVIVGLNEVARLLLARFGGSPVNPSEEDSRTEA